MKFYTRRRSAPVITIVSLVDILTVVLIFFVVTTTFKTQQPQVEIVLPKAVSGVAATSDTKPVILAITPKGDVFLDDKPIELDALGEAVKKIQASNGQLAMKADEAAPFGKIMSVLDALKIAGVTNVPALTREKK
jgi:biopolymer transport protein ExbD